MEKSEAKKQQELERHIDKVVKREAQKMSVQSKSLQDSLRRHQQQDLDPSHER